MKRRILFLAISILSIAQLTYGKSLSKANFVESVNILYLKGDYNNLIRNVEKGIKRYRLGRHDKKEVLYLAGLSYLELDDYQKARKYFYDIINMRGKEYKEAAHISLADSYFKENRIDEAISFYEEALNTYPRSHRLPGIYYNLGLCYKEKKDFDRAKRYFKKVRQQYETSFEADELADMLSIKIEPDFYIIQLGAFSSLRNAKKLVRRLAWKKYDSYIQKVRKDGKVLYKVRGGKFSNKYYAKRLLRRLKRDGFQAKIIVE